MKQRGKERYGRKKQRVVDRYRTRYDRLEITNEIQKYHEKV